MSMDYIERGFLKVIDWTQEKSMTKQAFKDDTDINVMLAKMQKGGSLSHLQKYEGQYGDFSEFDFLDAQLQLTRGREIFDALPIEMKKEFGQSPAEFFAFVNNPANKDRLKELYPQINAPGSYDLDMSGRTPPGASMDPDAPDVDAGVPPPVAPAPPGTEGA